VPSVIIPRYYPNNQTWELLRRSVQTELTGSLLTCRPDFSPEWRTYYDHRYNKEVDVVYDAFMFSSYFIDLRKLSVERILFSIQALLYLRMVRQSQRCNVRDLSCLKYSILILFSM